MVKQNPSIREKTHKGVDNIMDKTESIGKSSKENIDRLKEKTRSMKRNADSYIQKNPERAVLIAAGIGIAAGTILAASLIRKK